MDIGDYVAFQKHQELWILARATKEWKYTDRNMKGSGLKQAKVHLQDIEEYDPSDSSKVKIIERHLVLPLPRSKQEGNEWASRYYKGLRVYALYPNTTSFYPATVVDSSSYFEEGENVIVVEFDGDEDEKMKIPQRHIPSRFVAPIPLEFENGTNQSSSKNIKKAKSQLSKSSSLKINNTGLPLLGKGQMDIQMPVSTVDPVMMGLQNDDVLDLDDGEFEW